MKKLGGTRLMLSVPPVVAAAGLLILYGHCPHPWGVWASGDPLPGGCKELVHLEDLSTLAIARGVSCGGGREPGACFLGWSGGWQTKEVGLVEGMLPESAARPSPWLALSPRWWERRRC